MDLIEISLHKLFRGRTVKICEQIGKDSKNYSTIIIKVKVDRT